jgi:hypothetical protein
MARGSQNREPPAQEPRTTRRGTVDPLGAQSAERGEASGRRQSPDEALRGSVEELVGIESGTAPELARDESGTTLGHNETALQRMKAKLLSLQEQLATAEIPEIEGIVQQLKSVEEAVQLLDRLSKKRPRPESSSSNEQQPIVAFPIRPSASHRDCIKSTLPALEAPAQGLPSIKKFEEFFKSVDSAMRRFDVRNEPMQWGLAWWIAQPIQGTLKTTLTEWLRPIQDANEKPPPLEEIQKKLRAQIESPSHALMKQIISPYQMPMGEKERIATYRAKWEAKMAEIPPIWRPEWRAQVSFILNQLRKGILPELTRTARFDNIETMDDFWTACLDAELTIKSHDQEEAQERREARGSTRGGRGNLPTRGRQTPKPADKPAPASSSRGDRNPTPQPNQRGRGNWRSRGNRSTPASQRNDRKPGSSPKPTGDATGKKPGNGGT